MWHRRAGVYMNQLHKTFDALIRFTNRFTVKQKLIVFGGISLAIIMVTGALQTLSHKVYSRGMQAKQQVLRLRTFAAAKQSIANAFMKYYDTLHISEYNGVRRQSGLILNGLQKNQKTDSLTEQLIRYDTEYDRTFQALSDSALEKERLSREIAAILASADTTISTVISLIELKQSTLQMEGKELSASEAEFLNVARDGKIFYLSQKTDLDNFLMSGEAEQWETFATNRKIRKSSLLAFKSFARSIAHEDYIRLSEKFEKQMQAFFKLADAVHQYVLSEFSLAERQNELAGQFNRVADALVERAERRTGKMQTASIAASFVLFGVGGALLILLTVSMTATITKPINRLVGDVKNVGNGDLSSTIHSTGADEIALISQGLADTVASLRGMIVSIKNDAGKLTGNSETMFSISANLDQSARLLKEISNNAAAGAGESSGQVESIAAFAQRVSDSVASVASAIEQMSATTGEIARNCNQELQIATSANTQATEASELMMRLEATGSEVGRIVDLISDIADQTNLLALNATIEAASAGEAGKGFAVVAGEVKELAKQTAKATTEISAQISEMQSTTANASSAIKGITEVVENIAEISETIASAVEEQSATLTELSRNVSEASNGSREIAGNVQEASRGLSGISENVRVVNENAEETARESSRLRAHSEELSALSESLRKAVDYFTV